MFHAISPDFVIKPLAWDTCVSVSDTYFYISDFHNMGDEPPDIKTFCTKTAEIHLKSAEMHQQRSCKPPFEGNYGFHVATPLGMLSQDNCWCATWGGFYIQGMKHILAFGERTQGPSDELDALAVQLIEKVIPRLLRPFETGGLQIKPILVHGGQRGSNSVGGI